MSVPRRPYVMLVVLFLLVLGLSLVQFGVLEKRVNY